MNKGRIAVSCASSSVIGFCLTLTGLLAWGQEASNPPPVLTIGEVPSQGIVLSWPANATGYVLEESDFIGAQANWRTIAQGLALAGSTTSSVQIVAQAAPQFFRLRRVVATGGSRLPLTLPAMARWMWAQPTGRKCLFLNPSTSPR
jgi:hypothetical protein